MTTTLLLIIGLPILGLCGFIAWNQWQQSHKVTEAAHHEEDVRIIEQMKLNLERKSEEVGNLKAELANEQANLNKLQGQGKELSAAFMKLEAKHDALQKERDSLAKELSKFEESADRKQKEFENQIADLRAAMKGFEDEKIRIRREDEEKLRQQEEERDRIWNDHELNVIAKLTDLCKQPQYAFTSYSNTSLPEGFDGSLKPDFMISFLDQYIIFDAKKSKSESLQTYINNTVKSTVTKVKKNPLIASMIYLVVPTEAIGELKVHHQVHDGYTLFIVSPEALAPILASLKRIAAYEFAEQMDPQQRDNIVNFIADLDVHVSMRNSADLILTKQGADLLDKIAKIDPLLQEEVAQKKQEKLKNLPTIMNNVFKKLVASREEQFAETERLVAPRAPVQRKDLQMAEQVLQKLL